MATQRAAVASGSGWRALSSTFVLAISVASLPARLAPVPEGLILVEHPVLADRLTVLRDRGTSHGAFRQALYEAAAIMAVEVTRELPVKRVEVQTPLEPAQGSRLEEQVAVVPVLRAGLGMV